MTKHRTACVLKVGKNVGTLSSIIGKSLVALRNDDRGLDAKEMLERIDGHIKQGRTVEVMSIIYEYIVPLIDLKDLKDQKERNK